MRVILSRAAAQAAAFLQGRSYWQVRLKSGKILCELDRHIDVYKGMERDLEWHDDLVSNGDVLRVTDVWLMCPRYPGAPFGASAHMKIKEAGTVFQLKGAQVDIGNGRRYPTYQLIGRVLDKMSGRCEIVAYDYLQQAITPPYETNVQDIASWREGGPRIGQIDTRVVGLSLA